MATPGLLLGIDLGTSSVKAILIEPEGRVRGLAAREYAVHSPKPGWAEQDPEDWLREAAEAIRAVMATPGVSAADIRAIGLSGQMHGTVCLDSAGKVLRPAIIWADQRSREQVEHVNREIGHERLGEFTANPLATGFMLATWLWLREHEPSVTGASRHLLLPKDYLRFRITGQLGSEPSDASGTLLFDPVKRNWSIPLLEALDIDPGLLPPIHASSEIAGSLGEEFARSGGLRAGTPVVFGASDQASQAVGQAVLKPGMLSCSIGTGGQILAPLESPTYDPQLRLHLFCHAAPETWHLEAATLSAGLSLKWLRECLWPGQGYQKLADEAAQAEVASQGLFFLPYLVGERTPHMNPSARGGFLGLTLRHERKHLVRAVMEGVVFALRQGLDLIVALGPPVEHIVASGGASRHPLWVQLQADVFNHPVARSQAGEASALGAALLAGVGSGLYSDIDSACRQAVEPATETIYPIEKNVERYGEAYAVFCSLYAQLEMGEG